MDITEIDALLDTMPGLARVLLSECTQEELTELLDESKKEDLYEFVFQASDSWFDDFKEHDAGFREELTELVDWMDSLVLNTSGEQSLPENDGSSEIDAIDEDFFRQMQEMEANCQTYRDGRNDYDDINWIKEGF